MTAETATQNIHGYILEFERLLVEMQVRGEVFKNKRAKAQAFCREGVFCFGEPL